MNSVYEFWKNNSLKYIKPPRGGEFPEGWDVVDFFKNFNYEDVVDIGCGYGRLCRAFDPDKYLGLDFSPDAIKTAKEANPEYKFSVITNEDEYPESRYKLLYTVLLHQSDEDIDEIIKKLCDTTDIIIVAEICGRKWRRNGNPPVFNREVQEYEYLFAKHNKYIIEHYSIPYEAYKETRIEIMVFR